MSKDTTYLFKDENGLEISIEDIQMLEDIPRERIPKYIELLSDEDKYTAYLSMLILIAWGIEEGFNEANKFIDNQYDNDYEYEPHRIWGADNVYDVIADAFYISTFNTNNQKSIFPYLKKLLALYGKKYFDSKLKYVLLDIVPDKELLPFILNAVQDALNEKTYFQASQLLPVIAKYNKEDAVPYIKTFEDLLQYDKRIQYNLDEVKEFL